MVSYTWNPSAQEAGVGRQPQAQVQPGLRSEYQVLRSCIAKPCLKTKIKAENESTLTFCFFETGNSVHSRLPLQHKSSPPPLWQLDARPVHTLLRLASGAQFMSQAFLC